LTASSDEEMAMSDHTHGETHDTDAPRDQGPPEPAGSDQEEQDTAWSTGDPRVDRALARLDGLDDRDIHEHVDVYDSVHRDLADVLDDAGTPPTTA